MLLMDVFSGMRPEPQNGMSCSAAFTFSVAIVFQSCSVYTLACGPEGEAADSGAIAAIDDVSTTLPTELHLFTATGCNNEWKAWNIFSVGWGWGWG